MYKNNKTHTHTQRITHAHRYKDNNTLACRGIYKKELRYMTMNFVFELLI